MILTCSQDRNAYVWTPPQKPGEEWSPQIVLLRFERAATCCAWSPSGSKFIVGGSEKSVMICYYDTKNEFWVAKKINRHHSAILSLAWHPSGLLMGTSGCDCTAVLGAAVQTKAGDSKDSTLEVFGDIRDCASGSTFHKETVNGAWVSSVSFSPSGLIMGLCSRDATVRFIKFIQVDEEQTQAKNEELKQKKEKKEEGEGKSDRSHPKVMQTQTCNVLLRSLPLTCGLFIDDETFVGAGFEPQPALFKLKDPEKFEWAFDHNLTMVETTQQSTTMSNAQSAMLKFQQRNKIGTTTEDTSASSVKGHINSITAMKIAKIAGGKPTHISTSGLDGKLLFWTL